MFQAVQSSPTTILGTGSYVPNEVLSSAEMEKRLGLAPGWVEKRTGIRNRRIAAGDQASSDLAVEAGAQALFDSGVDPGDVSVLIVATSTPDRLLPATACTVQEKLALTNAAALDINAVCTGFVYALDIAQKMVRSTGEHALIIGVDTYSRILDYSDRRTSVLFGDGAGAVMIGPGPGLARIVWSQLGSDGSLADHVHIKGGGSREPLTAESLTCGDQFFRMDGKLVKEFVQGRLPQMVDEAMSAHGLIPEDVALLVPHQANVRLLEEVAKELGFATDQIAITGDEYGNTGAASVPITLDWAARSGRLDCGGPVLLAGFGGGMTWGTVVLDFARVADPVEVPA